MITYASKTSNEQKVSILIVDDQRHVSQLVAMAVREKGIQAEIADSVEKSWKYLGEFQPAAVLLNSLSEGFDIFDLLNPPFRRIFFENLVVARLMRDYDFSTQNVAHKNLYNIQKTLDKHTKAVITM